MMAAMMSAVMRRVAATLPRLPVSRFRAVLLSFSPDGF